jgi:large subunit ribosomal protein L22
MRLVVDLIRGKDVQEAVRVLHFSNKRASEALLKLLRSAMANADELGFDVERLNVSQAFVNEGRTLNRWRPRAQGRATRIRKRSCHTTIVLAEVEAGE